MLPWFRRPILKGRTIMKAVLLAAGVLGLAAIFGGFEPTPASGQPVTSDDVRLVSEQMSEGTSGTMCVCHNARRFHPPNGRRSDRVGLTTVDRADPTR
jgi:hypothetical protein